MSRAVSKREQTVLQVCGGQDRDHDLQYLQRKCKLDIKRNILAAIAMRHEDGLLRFSVERLFSVARTS